MKEKDVYKQVIDSLNNQDIDYVVYEHEPVYTMSEAESICENLPEESVKVLFVRVYETKKSYSFGLLVWTGNKKVDFEEVAKVLGAKRVKLASPEEVQNELGIEIGSLSPFGYDENFPVVVDGQLFEQKQLYINPGVHDRTIKMASEDLKVILDGNSNLKIV